MSKPRRTEPLTAAPIECPCGNTIHFTMGAPDRDAGGRLICSTCKWGAPPVPAAVVDSAPISETRAVSPKPVTPLTTGETVAALCQSLATVPAPAPVTSHDLERHAVRMRRAGLAPVTRDTCDRHERRFFGLGGGR